LKEKLVIRQCKKCGATALIIEDCTCENCGIMCCEEKMESLVPNTVEASIEKHIPVVERVEDEIFVKVNHVMEKEHFIEWICMVTEDKKYMQQLYPEQNAETRFKYVKGASVYAYCNKHGLWKTDVE